jgi:small-conductance mechanosensitive channel
MINQQLLDFIKQQLVKGLTREKITSDLLANGWTMQDVQEAFNALTISTPSVQEKTHSSRKILLYLSIIILLFSFYLLFYGSAFLAFFQSWVITDLALLGFIISGILGVLYSYYKEKNKGGTTKSALIKSSKFILITLISLLIALIFFGYAAGTAFRG